MEKMRTKFGMKQGLAFVILLFITGSAIACSCETFTPEEIATNEKYGFTKLKINYPTAGELWQRFKKRNSYHQPYSVSVLEDIKGSFKFDQLIVNVGDVEYCGRSVSYGQILYLVTAHDWPNSASVCNIKNENFAEEVKHSLEQKNLK